MGRKGKSTPVLLAELATGREAPGLVPELIVRPDYSIRTKLNNKHDSGENCEDYVKILVFPRIISIWFNLWRDRQVLIVDASNIPRQVLKQTSIIKKGQA